MKYKPVKAKEVETRKGASIYPEPFASLVQGRTKRKLGNIFELSNFGVNLTHLEPGAVSALLHLHKTQDEFIYVLEGTPTLKLGEEKCIMEPGECVGFKAGNGIAHQLVNESSEMVTYLEVGDRSSDDNVEFPNDDIKAQMDESGAWALTHKDGRSY